MPVQFSTRPDGTPPLPYPLDSYGYVLVEGRRYAKLAHVDLSGGEEGRPSSVVAFVERVGDREVLYKPDGWKKRGRLLSTAEAAPLLPAVAACRAHADGTGPATYRACVRLDDDPEPLADVVDLDSLRGGAR